MGVFWGCCEWWGIIFRNINIFTDCLIQYTSWHKPKMQKISVLVVLLVLGVSEVIPYPSQGKIITFNCGVNNFFI